LTAAYSNRAAAYADLGNFKNSINDWNVVIRRSPKDANAYNGRGNCHKALGDLQAALADFERAVALNPRFTKAIKNREAVRKSLQAGVSSLPGKNSEAVVAAAGGANVALPVSAPFSPSPPGTAGGGKAQPAAVNSRQADRQNATVRSQAAINADDRAAQAAAQAGATARPSAAVSPAESKAPASGQSPANAALPASSDGSVRRGQSVDGKPVAAAAAASVAPPAVGTEKNGAGSAAAISTNDKPRTGNWQAPAGGAGVDREQPKQAGAVGAQAAAKPDQRSANAAAFAASGNLARGPANPLLIFVSAFDHIAGNLLLACGQHQAAIDAFTAAVRSNPGDAFALYRRANAFAAAGQTEAALADYTAALQLAPRLHQAEAGRQRLTSNALDVHPIVKPGGL
jgi:tetratricopeptide (TPR) repeat protein